jgi:hypothetical protein
MAQAKANPQKQPKKGRKPRPYSFNLRNFSMLEVDFKYRGETLFGLTLDRQVDGERGAHVYFDVFRPGHPEQRLCVTELDLPEAKKSKNGEVEIELTDKSENIDMLPFFRLQWEGNSPGNTSIAWFIVYDKDGNLLSAWSIERQKGGA